MQFSPQEVEAAIELQQQGLIWEPQVGHFVWDQTGLIEQDSPFQPGVYFILDLKHFVRRAGTLQELQRAMVWLPTWHDARDVLAQLGVGNADILRALLTHNSLAHQRELLTLYGLIATRLEAATSGQFAIANRHGGEGRVMIRLPIRHAEVV